MVVAMNIFNPFLVRNALRFCSDLMQAREFTPLKEEEIKRHDTGIVPAIINHFMTLRICIEMYSNV
jgi:hypothetical protein